MEIIGKLNFRMHKIMEKGYTKVRLLPAPLSLMNYNEKWDMAKEEILKSYWRRTGKDRVSVAYGDPAFRHEDWMEEQWSWADVKVNGKRLKKECYTGPETMSSFLGEFLEKILIKQGLDPEKHYNKTICTEKIMRNRLRKRSRPTNKMTSTDP